MAPLFALLVFLLALPGCHSAAAPSEEGAYTTPAGMLPAHAARVALAPHALVRSPSGPVTTRASSAPADKLRLVATWPGSYAEGMRVASAAQPAAWLALTPHGALPASGRVRSDGSMLAFEEAFPHVTAAYGARARRVEEFLSVPSAADLPALAYELTEGPTFGRLEASDGLLWAYAKDGSGLFVVLPPTADDAAGKHVVGSWRLDGTTLRASLDLDGLTFPVLLDPTFETPEWFADTTNEPNAIAAAAGAYALDQPCSVLFGGANNSFTNQTSTAFRCSVDQRWNPAPTLTGGTHPPARSYAAMAPLGTAGTYLFSGYGLQPALSDLWRMQLGAGCATSSASCTGTWSQIPITTDGVSGPVGRYLHGMAYDGSRLLVWGGIDAHGNGLRDTWTYDGSTWTEVCASCFGGANGLYGFAYGTSVDPTSGARSIYASGGYNNPLGGGVFVANVFQWTGATWADVSGAPGNVPRATTGQFNLAGIVTPAPRYLHWIGGTGNGNLLLGSGVFNSQGSMPVETDYSDAWLYQANSGSPQWLLSPTLNANVGAYTPGPRESATAIYDETTHDLVLFGGLDGTLSGGTDIQGARVYRASALRAVTLTEDCASSDGVTCDSNQFTATVTFPGFPVASCARMNMTLLEHQSTWKIIPTTQVVSTSAGTTSVINQRAANVGGICQFSAVLTWDSSGGTTDLAVEAVDLNFALPADGQCKNAPPGEVATGGKPVCTPSGGFTGIASCGAYMDPTNFGDTVVGSDYIFACTNY